MVEGGKSGKRERRRRKRRKPEEVRQRSAKVASLTHESRGTRTRRRTNGGSLSSRGSAGMQCGLCAVLAGLFRRAMCIAGSRRGSGESCYQELTTEQQVMIDQKTCEVGVTITSATPERTSSFTHRCVRDVIPEVRFHEHEQSTPTSVVVISFVARTSSAEVTADSPEDDALFVRISEDATLPSSGVLPPVPASPEADDIDSNATRRFSVTDRLLIDSLDIDKNRTRHTGRFLTMHKRRRKRLTTRSLNQDPGLLDDIFHGQVQCILQRSGHWRFNAFTLETVSGGRSLPVMCVHLFQWYGLLQQFNLDVVRVWKLFALIEEGYHSTNPYHNSIHATDVTQAMHCFLQDDKIKKNLNGLEIMASLIAAVTHDLDHPGVNQPFLVATSNHLATLYENTSVLENHHWRSAIACLLESGVSEQLSPEIRPELQRYISSLILATDITRQQEFLTRFRTYLDTSTLDMERAEDRHFILQISLKCADISNPCRPWDISRKWSYKVCEEFFRQGDYERQLNLPVTPLCDRSSISIPKIQVGFFEFVVTPLYEEWNRFLGDGLSITLMGHLRANRKRWEGLIVQETGDDTKTEMSDVEEVQNSPSSEDEILQEDSGSVDLPISDSQMRSSRRLSLPVQSDSTRMGRRHSVPMHTLAPPSRSIRRDSVPWDHRKPPLVKLDDQSLHPLSSLSLVSSKSSLLESATNSGERPVSAENLLPETSIASITSSIEASRLCTILQPEVQRTQGKQLTRQQTFPPLQPYVRIRYLSTTAEMSKCRTETLMEAESPPSSTSTSPSREKSVGRRERKISSRSYTVDHRRRESAFADFNRLNVESAMTGEQRRRHSVQGMRDESRRAKRPSSAQEDPALIYANLTGGSRQRSSGSDSRPVSRSDSERQWSLEESGEDQGTGDRCMPLVGGERVREGEMRRFSTPVTEAKLTGEVGGRRFTTIPVTSDLPVHKVFFIGSPPESPPRVKSVSSSSDSGSEPRRSIGDAAEGSHFAGGKRDSEGGRHKGGKMMKMSDDGRMKENVDPRSEDKCPAVRRTSQGWARRRGSAPVGLMSRLDDVSMTVATRIDTNARRGSVPADITDHQTLTSGGSFRSALGPKKDNLPVIRRSSLPHEAALRSILGFQLTDDRENFPVNNNNNNHGSNNNAPTIGMPSPRRGSVPADISELRRDLFGRNSVNGKTRNRKKTLKRRSSGGPEMFAGCTDDNENGKWSGWKRELSKRDSIPEPSVKRRGSLPVEMVSISHAGRYNFR
uniref:Phosphodiesterase n=3 Tax=Fopius arisanus TaxID=64838 RepID=A0A0C9PSV9_9HYME